MGHGYYILIGQTPVEEPDLVTWAKSREHEDRRVALTHLPWCMISTVFLGLDHRWGDGPPLLFETMVFWDGEGEEQDRCSTWIEAEQMHSAMVAGASRLRNLVAALVRGLRSQLDQARVEWRELWQELRGVPLSDLEINTRKLRDWLRDLRGET